MAREARGGGGASGLPGPSPLPRGKRLRAGAGDLRGSTRAGHPCGPRAHPGADPGLLRGVGRGGGSGLLSPRGRGDALRQDCRGAWPASFPPGYRTCGSGSHLPPPWEDPRAASMFYENTSGCAPGHTLGLGSAPARGGICRELGESGGFPAAIGSRIQPWAGLFPSPPDRS